MFHTTNHVHTTLRQSGCTCTTAYPWGGGQNRPFFDIHFFSKPQIRLAHRFKTGPVHLHHCIPPMCGTKLSVFVVPHLRGMQWCRCTRSVLKPCAHDLWHTKKNWPLCPAHGGYAVVQVHLLCFKAVWQPFLYRTLEPTVDGRRSTCTTGSPSGHSDRGPLEVHKLWKFLTCSCNSCFG